MKEEKEYLTTIYEQSDSNTWDAWVKFYPEIRVEKAKSLVEAKVFLDILTNEQLENFQVVKEIINYERD